MGALSEHESALRASLQAEYGLRLLRDGRSDPYRSPIELAHLVANLPPGCALWRATGGELAWSAEMHMLAEIEHGVRVLAWQQTKDGQNGNNPPKPIRPPKAAGEVKQAQSRQDAKARRWAARQG